MWALIVENSPLLAEIVVRYPETANVITSRAHYLETVEWAFKFLLETKYPNEQDIKLVEFAKAELNLAPKPENYRNPFTMEAVSDFVCFYNTGID